MFVIRRTPCRQLVRLRHRRTMGAGKSVADKTMHILLIEDDTKTGEYLKKGLGESGYKVDWTQHGADGLHLALEN
ncbi:DNA-binding heavy metal response regulator, partial [Pseudomonas syringae pv. atrofaciens]